MCLGSGEAYPQRVAAESFEEDHLNRSRNQATVRPPVFFLFPAAPLFTAGSISGLGDVFLEDVFLPAPVFPIR
jgi:hypothetical protein